jgi:endonuclease YncB( thermonuclease family)
MKLAGTLGALALAIGGPALADPCKAIPDKGVAPGWIKPGVRFTGMVRHVVDGDGFCVGKLQDPSSWIEVRFADFDAPELGTARGREARVALSKIAIGRSVECQVTNGRSGKPVSFDRVIAVCRLGGRSIREALLREGVSEGGN